MRSLFLLALLSAALAATNRDVMTTQGFLQLPDDAFWASKVDLGPQMRLLMQSGREVFILDAPRHVDLRARGSLPAAALMVTPNEAAFDWTFRDHVLAVACEVERFHCLAGLAKPRERSVVRGRPRVLTPDMRGGRVGDEAVMDLRRSLELPWDPGTWQVLLVTRDRSSRPARVVLHSGGAIPPAPAPLPGAQLKLTASGKGLDTTLDLAVKARASRAVLQAGQGGNDVAVPLTFVVTGHAQAIPYVARRTVPGHWGPAGEPEHVVASARVAVKDLVPAGVEDSALYVWAFAGDQVSTPVSVALP